MLSNLPMSKNTLKYIVILVVLVIIAVLYFAFTRLSSTPQGASVEQNNASDTSNNAAFFVPPSSTQRQIEVTGEVVKVAVGEKPGSTHKIIDPSNGSILIYATSDDDKLNQQEGNVIKLVGSVPINEEVGSETLMKVDYISFK